MLNLVFLDFSQSITSSTELDARGNISVAMPGRGELQTVAKFMTSPNINPVEKTCRPPNNHAGIATCLIATR